MSSNLLKFRCVLPNKRDIMYFSTISDTASFGLRLTSTFPQCRKRKIEIRNLFRCTHQSVCGASMVRPSVACFFTSEIDKSDKFDKSEQSNTPANLTNLTESVKSDNSDKCSFRCIFVWTNLFKQHLFCVKYNFCIGIKKYKKAKTWSWPKYDSSSSHVFPMENLTVKNRSCIWRTETNLIYNF